jgi:hypothetical protein
MTSDIASAYRRIEASRSAISARARTNDRVIRLRYQLIDNRRRRFATLKVCLYGGDRNFGEHERSTAKLGWTGPTEYLASKGFQMRLESPSLITHPTFKSRGPISLHKVVTTVKRQQARIVQMQTCPGGCVKRGGKTVAGFDGREESLVISEDGFQPQLPEQRVTRREAMIKRSLWRPKKLYHGVNGDRAGTPFRSQRAGCSKKARIVKECSSHDDVDYMV